MLKFIKQLFCNHVFTDAKINPFTDTSGNYSAIYICEKCGKRKFHTFYKR